MSVSERDVALSRLMRAAWWTGVRVRADATLRRIALLLPIALLYAVAAITFIKVFRPGPETEGWIVGLGAVPVGAVLIGAALAWFRKRHELFGALALDKHYGLDDRISSAIAFHRMEDARRTPLMEAAIEDAVATARDLRPRRAAPLHFPRELFVAALLAAAAFGIGMLEVRTHRELPPEKRFEPMVMSPDDIDLFRKMADEMEKESQDANTLAAVRQFNQLVEDIAQRRLDRREVFKRMAALERDLTQGSAAEKEAREEGLARMARELEKSGLTKPIAKALEEKNLADAEKAMKELAEKLKQKRKKVSKQDLDRLRKALEAASKSTTKWQKGIEQRRKELESQRKRLLNKKKKNQKLSKSDREQLRKKERQLERLNREKKRADSARKQLSKLDQELAKAAQDLMRDMGASGEDLQNGAEDINRMAKKEMSEREKKDLLQRIREMREVLRQQGKGGKQRLQRMLRFGNKARGRKGRSGEGQDGKQAGKGQRGRGGGQQPGQGPLVMRKGSGQGVPVPIPGQGAGQEGPGNQPGSGQGEGGKEPGQGGGRGGKSWGTGHDENVKGEKTEIAGKTKDVTAAGIDSGQGEASAEVIYGAAERGFVGRGYQKVYTDYKTVAEDVMNRDEVPPGYRFYVRRYFQLIRPRE